MYTHNTLQQQLNAVNLAASQHILPQCTGPKNALPTLPRIVTMTIGFPRDVMNDVRDTSIMNVISESFGHRQNACYQDVLFRITEKTFRSGCVQLSAKLPCGKRLCIRIFSNGSVQISGLQSADHVITIQAAVLQMIDDVIGRRFNNTFNSFDIHMLNTVCTVPFPINLLALDHVLMHNLGIHTRGVQAHYAGLIVKYRCASTNTAAIHVFSTGTIMFKGLKLVADLMEGFAFITQTIYSYDVRQRTGIA